MRRVALSHRNMRLEVLPDQGGAVARLAFAGREVLRPADPGAVDPFATGAFALVPFANRIAGGVFRFGARTVRIEPNHPREVHPLHGHGWLAPWHVQAANSRQATLLYEHDADSWPWRYAAWQILTLCHDGLQVDLAVENRDRDPMPAGLGWHPYFRKSAGSRLRTQVQVVWLSDDERLPTRAASAIHIANWDRGARLSRPVLIDHCHGAWSGEAEIELPEEGLHVRLASSEPLGWLHIYSAPDQDVFCVEPVSHMPNAVNRCEPPEITGLKCIEPGERLAARVTLTVSRSDASAEVQ